MNKKEKDFARIVVDFYASSGRHDLPWRKNQTPYRVLVSELMLQQTQVERVIPKYRKFIKTFPSVKSLANAQLSEVVILWQGLGYNRRAKFLHQTAQVITNERSGRFPSTYEGLLGLPGIGPYTAAAMMNFAYNEPFALIETNVRQVYIHHFFTGKTDVKDSDILELVAKTMPTSDSREWFAALMDYGSYLKKEFGNINKKSKHYTKQSKFAGSDREIRGAIIRLLTQSDGLHTKLEIEQSLSELDTKRITVQLANLEQEGFVTMSNQIYGLQ
jgi:A/G-specific adenine glycosylase